MIINLLERTCALLKANEMRREDIAKGACVGLEWLRKFEGGHIDDPSVRRVQRVHDFLTSAKAAVRPARAATGAGPDAP